MAEGIGIASGLLTLAVFAFEASIALSDKIKSVKKHSSRVRELLDEIRTLSDVLSWLAKVLDDSSAAELPPLEDPLKQCRKLCDDFQIQLDKCLVRTGATLATFEGWMRFKFMGSDIDGFRHTLAAYKSTFNLAITAATFRKTNATDEKLKKYADDIRLTMCDLQEHLETVDGNIETIIADAEKASASSSDTSELRQLEQERLSTEKCLDICHHLSEDVDRLQLRFVSQERPEPLSEKIINEGLQEMENILDNTTTRLEKHMRDLLQRILNKSSSTLGTEEDASDLLRLQEEWQITRRLLNYYAKAEKHAITSIDNYATGDDNTQVLVSTNGMKLRGKNRLSGLRNQQLGGHIDSSTLQKLAQPNARISVQNVDANVATPGSGTQPVVPDGDLANHEAMADFRERYGTGRKLAAQSAPDILDTRFSAEGEAKRTRKNRG